MALYGSKTFDPLRVQSSKLRSVRPVPKELSILCEPDNISREPQLDHSLVCRRDSPNAVSLTQAKDRIEHGGKASKRFVRGGPSSEHLNADDLSAHDRSRALVEVLAFGRAVNAVSERTNLSAALFYKTISFNRTDTRAEVAAFALRVLHEYDKVKKSVVEDTVSHIAATVVEPGDSSRISTGCIKEEVPEETGTNKSRVYPLKNTSSSNKSSAFREFHKYRQSAKAFTVIVAILGFATLGTVAIETTDKLDRELLHSARKLAEQKRLSTINHNVIFGRSNGGLLISEGPAFA